MRVYRRVCLLLIKEGLRMTMMKSDVVLIREASAADLVISLSRFGRGNRLESSVALRGYVAGELSDYDQYFSDDDGNDGGDTALRVLSERAIGLGLRKFAYPLSGGTDVRLLPITDRASIVVLVVDEYEGEGESATYVQVEDVVVTSDATTADMDEVIAFLKTLRG